ncbi:GNAT family N-acetyltransferase [Rubeoparvulum massiliense]|uniref:GNAT family N-acetyltransferase n=1 Tax=Rubeoparvulum massiliense TaxID=1631346 RepID=UPI00065E8739|nr:GNAT family N-acetyltransferase [Rubeoparvulum massiliense]
MVNRIWFEKFNSDGDFPYYFSLVHHEDVMAMITKRAIPLNEARKNYARLLKTNKKYNDFGFFKVLESDSNQFIGLAKLDRNENNLNEAELGYMLLPDFWGKRYGTEIAHLMIERAEELKVLQRITAIIDPKNTASRKILLRNGFIFEKACEINGLQGEIFVRELGDYPPMKGGSY